MNKFLIPMLADFHVGSVSGSSSGSGVVQTMIFLLVIMVVCLLIWLFGRWVLPQLKAPAIVLSAWDILWAFVGLIWAVNFLLSFVGHGFVTF